MWKNYKTNDNEDLTVVLTDSDPAAVQLCNKNYRHNFELIENIVCKTELLCWGKDCWQSEEFNDSVLVKNTFDVVIGTDVIYNLSALPLFMKTACEALAPKGSLVLSHVPRFAAAENVESLIVEKAKAESLELCDTFRPADFPHCSQYEKLVERCGVLMIFEKV